MYRIMEWQRRYEPPKREKSGDGPLTFAKLKAKGHDGSSKYRRLMRRCEGVLAQNTDGPGCYALYCKMLELVACQPRQYRDGVIRDEEGDPATIDDIAFYCLWDAELVRRWIQILATPDQKGVLWIEEVDAVPTAAVGPATDAVAVPTAIDGMAQEPSPNVTVTVTETQTEQNVTETVPTDNRRDCISDSVSPTLSDLNGELRRERLRVTNVLALEFNIDVRYKRGRSNLGTIDHMAKHALRGPTHGELQMQKNEFLSMGRECARSMTPNPMGTFVNRFKARWGEWPELKDTKQATAGAA